MRFWLATLVAMAPMLALADQPASDFCKVPLSVKASPKDVADWKCRCSLQTVDMARAQQTAQALVEEVESLSWEAKYDAVWQEVRGLRGAAAADKKFWAEYVEGIDAKEKKYAALDSAIARACTWRGTKFVEFDRLCQIARRQ